MTEAELRNLKRKYGIVGDDPELNRALDIAVQVAPTDLSVLVTGENGTGKEVFAKIVHDHSLRKNKNFLTVNCGSIPEGTIDSELFGHEKGAFTGAVGEKDGYFGYANGGTLFMDEVGELPISTQARLLRVLEKGEYIRVGANQPTTTNVRIVAATNVNLPKAITERKFREDLYYRLNTIPVHIPPLRKRGRDIVQIFKMFSLETSEKYRMDPIRLTPEAEERLMKYSWPGNVRELRNLVNNMSVTARERTITPEILDLYGITVDGESTELVSLRDSQHTYANDRENLLQCLQIMLTEIKDLKATVNRQEQRIIELGSRPTAISPDAIVQTVPATTMSSKPLQQTSEFVEQPEVVDTSAEPITLEDIKKEAIKASLVRNQGIKKKVADEMDMSVRTLYRKIKEYGL